MPESEDVERITRWVDQVEWQWRTLGVPSRARRVLAADLQRDLEESASQGADLDELLHDDVPAFAHELAAASGVRFAPVRAVREPTWLDLSLTALAGGIGGAVLTWFVVFPVLIDGFYRTTNGNIVVAMVVIYGAAAVVTIGCAVLAVRYRFRDDPRVDLATLLRVAAGFTVGGLLGIYPTTLFAGATGYSSAPVIVLIETAIAAAFCVAGLLASLRLLRAGRAGAAPGSPSPLA